MRPKWADPAARRAEPLIWPPIRASNAPCQPPTPSWPPFDTIRPAGVIKSKQQTAKSRWVLIDVLVRNQNDEKVATGEAMVEFPRDAFCP